MTLVKPGIGIPGDKTPTALTLPPTMRLSEWAGVGVSIGAVGRASMWWIGDWINHGERLFGERYAQFLDDTGYASQTLLNAARVARLVAPDRRREELDWSHHEVVCGLPPETQSQLLRDAVVGENGQRLTIGALRARVRQILGKPAGQSRSTDSSTGGASWVTIGALLDRLAREHQPITLWPEYQAAVGVLSRELSTLSTGPTTDSFLVRTIPNQKPVVVVGSGDNSPKTSQVSADIDVVPVDNVGITWGRAGDGVGVTPPTSPGPALS